MKVLVIDCANLTLQYTLPYCEELEKNLCDVTLICSKYKNQKENHLDLFSTIPIFFFKRFKKIVKFIKGINHIIGFIRTFFFIQKRGFHLIHFQITPIPLIDLFFIKLIQKKYTLVATIHNTEPFHGEKNFFKNYGFDKLLKEYDYLIAHTMFSKDILVNKYQLTESSIKVINHPLFKKPKPFKGNIDYDKKQFLNVLFFGTLSRYKGLDMLLESIGKLDSRNLKKIKLTIAGKPIMNINPLIDKSAKFKIKNTIEWHIGWIEDKFADALFTKADLIVMPYKNIDGSGVLVQSIEYNVPCVASNIGGFSELIQNHKTGFLIDPVNSTSLRNIFFDILKNPNILNDIRTEIRKEALNLPTWDDMAKYVISLDISQN